MGGIIPGDQKLRVEFEAATIAVDNTHNAIKALNKKLEKAEDPSQILSLATSISEMVSPANNALTGLFELAGLREGVSDRAALAVHLLEDTMETLTKYVEEASTRDAAIISIALPKVATQLTETATVCRPMLVGQ